MLTFILGFLAAFVLGFAAYHWPGGPWWSMAFSLLGLAGVVVPINLWMKKRLERIFGRVQACLTQSQDTLRRKANQMQRSFGGSPKTLVRLLEKEQAGAAEQALAILDECRPLFRWNVLAEKQVSTVRGQLYYQLKRFEEADRCLARGMVLDPLTAAMKLARLHMRGETAALDKELPKAIRRFKGEKATILYALYAWVLVKQGRAPEAMQLLAKGKDETESEVLRENWEHLANNRERSFSNAGLGDQWYALHLETPKVAKVRQRQGGGWFR